MSIDTAPPPPPPHAAAPFTRYLFDDIVRLVVILLLTYMIAVAVKIAYLRWRRRVERPPEESPWAILSYVMLATAPVVQGSEKFGEPIDPARTAITAAALLFGAVAAYKQVVFEGWGWALHARRRRRAGRD